MSVERPTVQISGADSFERAQALLEQGRALEAAGLLENAIADKRGGLLARLLLIRARIASGDASAALALAREVAHSNMHVAEAALALGEALANVASLPAAIAEYQRALRLDPTLDGARLALARTWLSAGEPEKAEDELSRVQRSNETGKLRRRAARMRTQERADAGYVRHLFDQFSTDYDQRMRGQLGYAAPEILRALGDVVSPPGADKLAILDLGCGTGLSGEAFKDLATQLDGIELSPSMLEKAREKAIYDHLACCDIETVGGRGTYDLILAADTLVYLGDLSATFVAVASQLRSGGFFLFTVEQYLGAGFALGVRRRWQHSESYLRELSQTYGFEIVGLVACTPRTEAAKPVNGLACALKLSGAVSKLAEKVG